ncbi:MAG: sigma54 specific transcriptional regulator, Fis family, partial [uncultured bacterium]
VRWLLERALVLGQTFQPVLLQGEAGVGKKHLASIMSRQKSAASVFVLDAACVPDYEQKEKLLDWLAQGAMAGKNKKTFLGTLIIAQITQLHPEIQEALAEYLKDNVLSLQGKNFELTLQLIATSSHSLSQAVKDGFMREDLYNILSHAQWHIPSLSERVEDLPLLVAYHLRQGPHQEVRHYFSRDAMTALCQHEWDHNVAELFASVDAIVQQASQTMVSAHMLPNRILQRSFYRTQAQSANVFEQTYNEAKEKIVADFTRAYFHDLLAKVDGNLTVAAEQAGMDRSNLKKLIKRYGLL